jgi:hypothetical protein
MTETIARWPSGWIVGVPHIASRSRSSGRMSIEPSRISADAVLNPGKRSFRDNRAYDRGR